MIKIFGVGNSFTEDAHAFLSELCATDGIEIKTVCPFIGGCSFKRHCNHIENDTPYELIVNGRFTGEKVSFMQALQMEDWDIVTFNQGSVQSGRPFTYYPYLHNLKELVLKQSPRAKLYLYQTWSYEEDSTHPYYYVYHSNQKEMWIRSRDSYQLASVMEGLPVIPVGDVIQDLRENAPEFDVQNGGIRLTRDGYHLNMLYGRYAAALTFYAALFSGNVQNHPFIPTVPGEQTDENLLKIIQNAVSKITNRDFAEPEE
ncbi:MAG: DUF4886 domain-containing protein [Clostridia bacterium]|nr:DUF4886 domain-containing protein [Clostridia bacterium]